MNAPVSVTFRKDYRPNTEAAYMAGEGAAFPLEQAIQVVAQSYADFTKPDDLTTNHDAVTAATPTPLVGVDTFLQTTADGSDPTLVLRRRDGK